MGRIGKESADERKLIRRMSIIGVGLVAFQQLCGANVLMFHAEELIGGFIATEVPSEKVQTLTVVMYTTQVMHLVTAYARSNLLTYIVLDKW